MNAYISDSEVTGSLMSMALEKGKRESSRSHQWELKPNWFSPASVLCAITGFWTIWNGLAFVSLSTPLWSITFGTDAVHPLLHLLFSAINLVFGGLYLVTAYGVAHWSWWSNRAAATASSVILVSNLFRMVVGLLGLVLCVISALAVAFSKTG